MEIVHEEWRPVVGHEASYEVSNLGSVRSKDRAVVKRNLVDQKRRGIVLSMHADRIGYIQVTLCEAGKRFSRSVHTLVAKAFLGPTMPGMEVNHRDADKANNSVANLEYVTRAQNIQHAVDAGLIRRGSESPRAKLTESDVTDIRKRHAAGEKRKSLALMYGVSMSCIQTILSRKKWSHVA